MLINKKIAAAIRTTIADPRTDPYSAFRHTVLTVDEWRRMLAAHRAVPGAFPALCRTTVRLNDVLLSLRLSFPASAEEQLKTMPVQTASGWFGRDVVEGRPACGEGTSVSA